MTQQQYNDEMADLQSVYFVDRNEMAYSAKSIDSLLVGLLGGVRAYWPMSAVGYSTTGRARDISGNGHHLDDFNTVEFGRDVLVPYAEFDGTNALRLADGGAGNWADFTGLETYIKAADRGMFIIGWVYSDRTANTEYLISKIAGGQVSYYADNTAGAAVRFLIDDDGTAATPAFVDSVKTRTVGRWAMYAGSFDPGASVDVWLADRDGFDHQTQATAIASIFSGTATVSMGSSAGGTQFFQGKLSRFLMGPAKLDNALVRYVFEQTRKAYRE